MILLDYRDTRPIYEQVVEKLERLIVSGGLEPLTIRRSSFSTTCS